MDLVYASVDELRSLPVGTVGNDIARCLDSHSLTLVPGFESHDLKHVLLDFEMTPEDEIRMQAFMLGNGNHSIPSYAILGFGAVLLPELWPTFYRDYRDGQQTSPISKLTIDEVSNKSLNQVQESIKLKRSVIKNRVPMKVIAKAGVYATICAGVFGMLFCLPFLFSASMADLVGAGFPFIGGAILVAGGLNALVRLVAANEHKLETDTL